MLEKYGNYFEMLSMYIYGHQYFQKTTVHPIPTNIDFIGEFGEVELNSLLVGSLTFH